MVTCQTANLLKTPSNISWAFKMVSVWLTRLHNHEEDCWQVSRRQSLTPFTRRVSHKHSLPKKLAVHRVLYPSMLTESWVEGKSVEEKDAQPTDRTAALWGLSRKINSRIWWTSQGMDWGWGQDIKSTTHRRVKEFGYSCRQRRLTWAKEKKNWTVAQWSKFLFSDKSKFCISFGNQGPRVWRKGGEVAWSPVWSFHSLWWFGVQCHLLVLVHCVFWKPTSLHPFTKTFWRTSCFLLLTSFLTMLISFSSRIWRLSHCQKLVKWPLCLCAWLASKLTRPEPQRESMGYCQEENEKQETKKMQMSWRPLSKKPGLPYHLSSATNWSPPCHAELRQ